MSEQDLIIIEYKVEGGKIVLDAEKEADLLKRKPTIITGDDRACSDQLHKYEKAAILYERSMQLNIPGNDTYLDKEEMIVPLTSEYIPSDVRSSIIDSEYEQAKNIIAEELKSTIINDKPHVRITSNPNIAVLEFNKRKLPFMLLRRLRVSHKYHGKNFYERWYLHEFDYEPMPLKI